MSISKQARKGAGKATITSATTVQIEAAIKPEVETGTNWYLRIGIALFALLMTVPAIAGLFLTNDIETMERRRAHNFPWKQISELNISAIPGRIDKYLNDRVGFRDQMVFANGLAKYSLLAPTDRQGIVFGENDMIFRMSSNIGAQYLGHNRYKTKKGLNGAIRKFLAVKKLANAYGAQFYMTIAPNKVTVYGSDFAPAWLQEGMVEEPSQLQQVERALSKQLGTAYVSSLKTLNSHRKMADLYSQYGTHWDELGAYFSYRQIMLRMKQDFADLKVLDLDKLRIRRARTNRDTGTARVMGLSNYLLNDYALVGPRNRKAKLVSRRKSKNNRSGAERLIYRYANPKCGSCPKLLILGDSFSLRWHKVFPESFSEVLFMHHDRGRFDKDVIKQFKPDAVVLELVEQQLSRSFSAPEI